MGFTIFTRRYKPEHMTLFGVCRRNKEASTQAAHQHLFAASSPDNFPSAAAQTWRGAGHRMFSPLIYVNNSPDHYSEFVRLAYLSSVKCVSFTELWRRESSRKFRVLFDKTHRHPRMETLQSTLSLVQLCHLTFPIRCFSASDSFHSPLFIRNAQ